MLDSDQNIVRIINYPDKSPVHFIHKHYVSAIICIAKRKEKKIKISTFLLRSPPFTLKMAFRMYKVAGRNSSLFAKKICEYCKKKDMKRKYVRFQQTIWLYG